MTIKNKTHQPLFFSALVKWDDGDDEFKMLFCAYEDENQLTRFDPKDEDIFHYGLTLENAKKIIGVAGVDSGEGEFTILEIICDDPNHRKH